MRLLFVLLASVSLLSASAQTALPIPSLGYGYTGLRPYASAGFGNISVSNQKWQVKPFASLNAGYIWYNGGISYISAPVGLALLHPLSNNVTAFGAVSAVPTFFSVNSFANSAHGFPGSNFSRTGLGVNGRVEAGLMYTNDDKTFSISGSIGVERAAYPVYPSYQATRKNQ